MATGFTRAKASAILESVIKPTTYVALSTTTPTETGSNFTEPSADNGYKRHAFGNVNKTISGQVANDDIIFLFEATGDCGSVTHVGLSDYDSRGSGVFLMAQLAAPLSIGAGYVPLIRAKSFIIGLDKDSLEAYG